MTSVASVGNSEPEDSLQKTVLCVFRERRRPVTFNASADEKTEKKNLFDAVKASFSDVLSSGEGTSNPGSYFLQTESSEWGPIDITGFVEDRATVHLCYSTNMDQDQASSRAKNLCEKLRNPSAASSRAISSLFPACGSQRKRKFNPLEECVVGEQQRRKKAANPSVKGRSKSVKVVVLTEIPRYIPKGIRREELRKAGRVKELSFRRVMSEDEVQRVILEGFQINAFQFLQGSRDNTLKVNATQSLDGNAAIQLAGSGSLYIQEQPLPTTPPTPPSTSTSPDTLPGKESLSTDSSNPLMSQLTELITKLRKPDLPSFMDDDSDDVNVESVPINELHKPSINKEAPLCTGPFYISSDEDEFVKMEDEDILEFRRLRAEQDRAYEESLQADIAKEKAKTELLELQENLGRLQSMMREKFPANSLCEGIKIAFKLPDGTKIEYVFQENSTVKDISTSS